jgi:hypothetical protein
VGVGAARRRRLIRAALVAPPPLIVLPLFVADAGFSGPAAAISGASVLMLGSSAAYVWLLVWAIDEF